MARSKKILTRTRRIRRVRKSRRVKRTYRRRQRGGLAINANNSNTNNTNNNNNNNNNMNHAQKEEIQGLNLIYVKDLYDAIDGIESEEEKKRMVKAVGGWLYAVFVVGPKKNPGVTKESMIESVQYETFKYLEFELDPQNPEFDYIMDKLFQLYTRIESLDDESFAYNNIQEQQEEFQTEFENQLGL
jgi:hypothetical protein